MWSGVAVSSLVTCCGLLIAGTALFGEVQCSPLLPQSACMFAGGDLSGLFLFLKRSPISADVHLPVYVCAGFTNEQPGTLIVQSWWTWERTPQRIAQLALLATTCFTGRQPSWDRTTLPTQVACFSWTFTFQPIILSNHPRSILRLGSTTATSTRTEESVWIS